MIFSRSSNSSAAEPMNQDDPPSSSKRDSEKTPEEWAERQHLQARAEKKRAEIATADPTLTLEEKDFFGLPETGVLEYYDPTGNRRISMISLEKHQSKTTSITEPDETN